MQQNRQSYVQKDLHIKCKKNVFWISYYRRRGVTNYVTQKRVSYLRFAVMDLHALIRSGVHNFFHTEGRIMHSDSRAEKL
jgi:hypothetical protein